MSNGTTILPLVPYWFGYPTPGTPSLVPYWFGYPTPGTPPLVPYWFGYPSPGTPSLVPHWSGYPTPGTPPLVPSWPVYPAPDTYSVTQKLPHTYTTNHATFPISIRKITVQICGNFWVTRYVSDSDLKITILNDFPGNNILIW